MSIEQHLVLHELTLAPSSDWVHRHEGWIILRVAAGLGYWSRPAGPVGQFGPGDVLVAHSQCPPTLRVSALGPVRVQFFLLQPELLSGLLSLDEMQGLTAAGSKPEFKPAFFAAEEALAKKFAEMAELPDAESAAVRIRRVHLWLEATAKLRTPPAAAEKFPLRRRFQQLVRRMPAGDFCDRSLPELAQELGCSTRHFHRLFREEFGQSLRAFQTDLRLTRARKLLVESNTKIINVAQESGYNHLGLFNSMFKRRFGMTPGDLRRQARNQPAVRQRRSLAAR